MFDAFGRLVALLSQPCDMGVGLEHSRVDFPTVHSILDVSKPTALRMAVYKSGVFNNSAGGVPLLRKGIMKNETKISVVFDWAKILKGIAAIIFAASQLVESLHIVGLL